MDCCAYRWSQEGKPLLVVVVLTCFFRYLDWNYTYFSFPAHTFSDPTFTSIPQTAHLVQRHCKITIRCRNLPCYTVSQESRMLIQFPNNPVEYICDIPVYPLLMKPLYLVEFRLIVPTETTLQQRRLYSGCRLRSK